ncbi:unnamed protein product [Schistosoma margrebowiei]|uniref:Uncharacterized protein n=1 Tax=Schistosoma margrebowiei TaxID=48269 RepID=A0A183L9E0_9TREM|nr:unnamed protein product [Schistosoma margrebowiei]
MSSFVMQFGDFRNAAHQHSPSNLILRNPFKLSPLVIHPFHILFYFPTSCVICPSSFPLPFRIPSYVLLRNAV